MSKTGTNLCKVSLILAASTLASLLLVLVTGAEPAKAATTLPPGFEDQVVAGGITEPMDLAFENDDPADPDDGRMFVITKRGQFRVYSKDGQLLKSTGLGSRLCTSSDHGLMGMAVDPNFSNNGYVYLFYTRNKSGGTCPSGTQWDPTNPNQPVNQVVRFTVFGDALNLTSEQVLLDNIPTGQHHSGGSMGFGKDGYLYASVGDALCDYAGNSGCGGKNDAARDLNAVVGKILRITRNGDIPPTNPYTGTDSARCNLTAKTEAGKKCQEIFATGFRNPFRIAFDPDASNTRLFVNDVGDNAWEEIDEVKVGADYGWNTCEGNHDNPGQPGSTNCAAAPLAPPVHEYHHDTGCTSIVGGAFVPDGGGWPTSYNDTYLYSDHVCNKIFELKPKQGGGYAVNEFASFVDRGALSMAFAPHGSSKALYYTNLLAGEVRRIVHTGTTNQAPTAAISARPTSGDVPLDVAFDGSASTDPDPDDTLTYLWDFGDGSNTVETTTPTTTHTYATDGAYSATLTVRDTSGAQDTARVEIEAGNVRPDPTIGAPAANKLFKVGENIVAQGSATDPQDGQLAGSSLSWEIRQWHNGHHFHPFASGTGSQLAFTAPSPEDFLSATGQGNYLEIRLTATDSDGFTNTVIQELQPHRVDVTFASQPSGLSLEVNGNTVTTPRTLVSWEGFELSTNAPSPQPLGESTYAFDSWSDGEARAHDIVTPAAASTYTATYTASECTISGTSAGETLEGTSGTDVICGGGGNDTIKGLGGNDVFKGQDGNDKLFGGAGDDTLEGGNGADVANYSDAAAGVTASLVDNSATGAGSDAFVGMERLTGSSRQDTLTGSDGVNVLNGLGAADTLSGLGGADKLIGSAGPDKLLGDAGNDSLNSVDKVNGNDSLDGGGDSATCATDANERSIVNCEQ